MCHRTHSRLSHVLFFTNIARRITVHTRRSKHVRLLQRARSLHCTVSLGMNGSADRSPLAPRDHFSRCIRPCAERTRAAHSFPLTVFFLPLSFFLSSFMLPSSRLFYRVARSQQGVLFTSAAGNIGCRDRRVGRKRRNGSPKRPPFICDLCALFYLHCLSGYLFLPRAAPLCTRLELSRRK